MMCVMLYLCQVFLKIFAAAQAPAHKAPSEVRKPTFPQGIPGCFGSLGNPNTGTSNILQWTDMYLISWGCCPPSAWTASMNLSLMMFTRSSLSSYHESAQIAHEKIHAFQFTRKLMCFPYLSTSLFKWEPSTLHSEEFSAQRRAVSFPLQRSCKYQFSPLSSARRGFGRITKSWNALFVLYMTANRRFQE